MRYADPAAQRRTCVAEANGLCRLLGPFQDIADLGLGAAAVGGGEHARSTMHLVGLIPIKSCGPPIRRDPRQVSINLPSLTQQVVVGLEAVAAAPRSHAQGHSASDPSAR